MENRRLSSEESARPGHWSFDKTPYLRGISRAYSDAPDQQLVVIIDGQLQFIPWKKRNERLVWMSGAQVGKTNWLLNIIGYHIDIAPLPMLVVQPNLDMLKVFSEQKLDPMLRDTPCLGGKVQSNKSKDGKNTIASKSFPGGHVSIIGAGSPNSGRMRSIAIALIDEIDGYELSSGKQGDPLGLVTTRTATYKAKRKIIITSTPLLKETSRIETLYLDGTQEEWQHPCPTCGQYQVIRFGKQLDFETCDYVCEHCGVVHHEHEWKAQPGCWIAQNLTASTRTFHTSAMDSHLAPWSDHVQKFRDAIAEQRKGNNEPYKEFVNNVEGLTYEEKGETLEEIPFANHVHRYADDIPAGVLLLTAAADVQDNRVEVELRGWGVGFETWGIRYQVIDGTMDKPSVWEALDEIRNRIWQTADGRTLQLARLLIDSGGHYTKEVYNYTRPRAPQVYAIKGSTVYTDPTVDKVSHVGTHKTPLFLIGTIQAKDNMLTRLRLTDEGPGYCHWPVNGLMADGLTMRGYDENYYAMLVSEKRVLRNTGGKQHYTWEPRRKGIRNEGWDALIYNYAAVIMLVGQHGPTYLDRLAQVAAVKPTTPPRPPAQPAGRRVLSPGVAF